MADRSLQGLKAAALTTESLPVLQIVFRPRFRGSFESRWERGTSHLVPLILRNWDVSSYTLCGLGHGEEQVQGNVCTGEAVPRRICKKCQEVAAKRGYGAREQK